MVSADRKSVDTTRFRHTDLLFADQYFHIYNARLQTARSALIQRSRFRWGDEVKNVPLEQLNHSLGSTDVFVIGTLFKQMPQQPSVLRELEADQLTIGRHEPDANFTSEEDSLVLHETDENVQVVGDIDIHLHVTGIPVSLKGHQLNGGAKFHVVDICYAGPDLSVYKMPQQNSQDSESNNDTRMLIVSGLEFGFDSTLSKEKSAKVIDALKKLRDYIMSTKIKKVIVAGNSIAPGLTKNRKLLYETFRMFDKYLFTLGQSGASIDVMPGKNDPSSFLLPQQPFHPKLLPESGILQNINPVTNPHLMNFEGYVILGTSGENVEAIRKYSRIEYSTTALKNTLEWGHIVPSAPDNVSCVPFKEKDPFIIDYVPDIYFAGNQPEFAVTTYSTETKNKIQLISVPKFVDTRDCVLVDLSNLETELISFG